MAAPPPPPAGTTKKPPQQILGEFWKSFHSKSPGKVTSIFPRALYSTLLPTPESKGVASTRNAQESYEAAARECRAKVKAIVRECERTNQKFTDPEFDIERDPNNNCLNGLVRDGDSVGAEGAYASDSSSDSSSGSGIHARKRAHARSGSGSGPEPPKSRKQKRGVQGNEYYSPGSVHRVDWIFENPQFTVNGYSSSDIKQGANGNCWWLAAVATIAHRKDLMDKVCVARDEECGVYGFVFQRDGEWISTAVDDSLYLSSLDFDWYGDTYDSTGKKGRRHRERYQTGSEALYFAHCDDKNETWLPLLEKAYAKIHGDYEAISGGWPGEGVEDMTGGVTSTIVTNRVLRKDKLWRELTSTEGNFVFALAAMDMGAGLGQKTGLALGHAYSILQSRQEVDEEGKRVRLVQIRNPWGESSSGIGEWMGPWSDGSKEWTPYWMKRLNHTFGDDGVFWMSYEDMLANFMYLHRTRLFDEKWTVVQQWTAANITWVTGYLQTKFVVDVKKPGLVVFVLTQLDDRYFQGLEGEYYFQLHFILRKQAVEGKDGSAEPLCHVMPVHDYENRSVSCEVDLDEAGIYEVIPKVTAVRHDSSSGSPKPVEEVVKQYATKNPQKLRQVGARYDVAHAKGGVPDEDGALEDKKQQRRRERERKKAKEKRKQQKALVDAAKALETTAKIVSDIAGEASGGGVKAGSKEETNKEAVVEEGKEKKTGEGVAAEASEGEKPAASEDKANTVAAAAPKSSAEPIPATKQADEKAQSDNQTGQAAPSEKPVEEAKVEEAPPVETQTEEPAAVEEAPVPDPAPEAPNADDAASDGSSSESDSDSDSDDGIEDLGPASWNAVCVFSLRVYAQDPEISIALEKQTDEKKTDEEKTDEKKTDE